MSLSGSRLWTNNSSFENTWKKREGGGGQYLNSSMATEEEIKFCWVAYFGVNYSAWKTKERTSKTTMGLTTQLPHLRQISDWVTRIELYQAKCSHSCLCYFYLYSCWRTIGCGVAFARQWTSQVVGNSVLKMHMPTPKGCYIIKMVRNKKQRGWILRFLTFLIASNS